MRKTLLALLLLVAYSVSAQIGVTPKTITNTITPQHVNIPGTHLYIVPPDGFTIATDFIGLQTTDGECAINIMDLSGGNYYTNAADFSPLAFEKKGISVIDYAELTINEFPARYIYVKGDLTGIDLVLGDSTFSVILMGISNSGSEKEIETLKKALLSVVYDKTVTYSPLEQANFILNDSKSKFKFYQNSAFIYLYTLNGLKNDAVKNEPMLIVTELPKDNANNINFLYNTILSSMQSHGMTDIVPKHKSSKKINGYNALEVELDVKLDGNEGTIYLLVAETLGKAVFIQGVAKNNYKTNLKEFKKLAHTLKFK